MWGHLCHCVVIPASVGPGLQPCGVGAPGDRRVLGTATGTFPALALGRALEHREHVWLKCRMAAKCHHSNRITQPREAWDASAAAGSFGATLCVPCLLSLAEAGVPLRAVDQEVTPGTGSLRSIHDASVPGLSLPAGTDRVVEGPPNSAAAASPHKWAGNRG